ncbi:MAG TPA: TetR/AcrR family transcriptional regulator [Deltaproteobacteria bacterium]|nr:TetR/AcrR family transcriptional regulator [Deltaproteobacteria bacterium]
MSPRARGRPRSGRADREIHRAALEILGREGYAAASIERIAAEAGVSRPTIYRRHANRAALLVAAVEAAFREANPVVPDTGSAAEDVRILLSNTIRMLRKTPIGGVVRAIVPELAREADLRRLTRRLLNDRRRLLRDAIVRGIERGEFSSERDVELAIDGLLGAIYLRLLFTGRPITGRFAGDLVNEFLLDAPGGPAGSRGQGRSS